MPILQPPLPRTGASASPFAEGFDRPILAFIIAIHVVPIALCLIFPSWPGIWAMVVLYVVTGLGVTIGYHRKLTHHSFKSPRWVDHTLAVLGLLAGEGPPIFWVAHHRKHHKFSDHGGRSAQSSRRCLVVSHALALAPTE